MLLVKGNRGGAPISYTLGKAITIGREKINKGLLELIAIITGREKINKELLLLIAITAGREKTYKELLVLVVNPILFTHVEQI